MKALFVSLSLLFLLGFPSTEGVFFENFQRTFSVKVHKKGTECTIIKKGMGQVHRHVQDLNDIVVVRKPQSTVEHEAISEEGEMIEIFGEPKRVMDYLTTEVDCHFLFEEREEEHSKEKKADVVRPIVQSGSPSNRIDVVFMGDGYTSQQEELHFQDMARLTDDMFNGDTFSSYLPLFNIWGVFRESAESGIGYYSRPKNTAFGLYRDGTELRGVYCSKPTAARDACRQTGTDACDFPSLIGNDPYYGGLGGEFTISTSSPTTGTIVLRHEFGHNFGVVGEEYDGGSAYWGANSHRTSTNLPWAHWLTVPDYKGPEVNALRVQDYAWYDLGKGPYTITFTSDGKFSRWLLRFSVSGCEKPDSLILTLDGVRLSWNSSLLIDRSFFEYKGDNGFSSGTHQLVFASGFPPEHEMIRQLCSVSLVEYANETDYHLDNNYIGAYPTYRLGNSLAGYRPNNERCLMRNMTSTQFCVVCQENNWLQFLARMSLLDGVKVEGEGEGATKISAELVPLAQLREGGSFPNEEYLISWEQNGSRREDLEGLFSFSLPRDEALGSWTVLVEYRTSEVRSDPRNLLKASQRFTVQ